MLEKIGLPAKPSLRGSNWVVDASHCQGCSSQFTFVNRKHHCRRCGGLFCNSCTLQRMFLRGQGDSPVRICDPCKKLEEAARFELRHGHRSKAGKGSSRVASKNEDEVLAQLLASDAKGSSAGADSDANIVSGIERTISGASSSNSQEYVDLDSLRETGSATPEELRQQAVDEKKKYKFLKGEGKPEEALKAFKRGKELERQAEALEIALRKSRRKVLPDEKLISAEPGREKKPRVGKDKDKDKDDLLSELKELGWSEMDLHNEDKKPASATVEGELSALIGELPQKPNDGKTKQGIDKTQIAAHKRKALMLKREGKLAEAKEELKRAKVLEKQVEEQELLAGAEDSDDELSALIRSMDNDKRENLPQQKQHDFRLDDLIGVAGTLDEESNFEVTEEDLADPEMTAALKSLGWAEDYDTELATQSVPFDRGALSTENPLHIKAFGHNQDVNASTLVSESFVTQGLRNSLDGVPRRSKAEVQRELLGFKRKALALRREGKNEEAEEVLKMAKALEAQISEMEASKNKFNTEHTKLENNRVKISTEGSANAEHEEDVTENDLRDPSLLSMLEGLGWKDEAPEPVKVQEVASKKITDSTLQSVNAESTIVSSSVVSTSSPRTKAKIQRELLGLKRRALDLRRKGKLEEAEETLRMAKALEMEIEELELPKGPRVDASEKRNPESLSSSIRHEEHGIVDNAVKVNDGPTQEAASLDVGPMNLERTRTNRADTSPEKSYFWKPEASGYGDESIGSQNFAQDDMAAKGGASSPKVVHSVGMMDLLTGSDWRNTQVSAEKIEERPCYVTQSSHDIPPIEAGAPRSADEDRTSKDEALVERKETQKNKPSQVNKTNTDEENQKRQVSIQQEILIHKKKAVALKREGRLAEAKEALKQAKLLESLEEDKPQPSVPISSSTIPPVEIKEEDTSKVTPKPLSSRERFKIQQESLSHKRQALKLRKEGRIKDAEAEFDFAKTLEAQLEESASHDPVKSSEDGMNDEVVEDLLDPELLSALKAIGIDDSSMVSQGPKKREPVKHNLQSRENSGQDSIRLEEQIKAEKVKAVNLKRAGKQAEALDALRHAKMLEKKLNAL